LLNINGKVTMKKESSSVFLGTSQRKKFDALRRWSGRMFGNIVNVSRFIGYNGLASASKERVDFPWLNRKPP